MSKYIITNCPAYEHDEEWDYHICKRNLAIYETTSDACPDCTDCVMKQIVELCEQYKKDYNTTNGVWLLANNITNLLDIQEVE